MTMERTTLGLLRKPPTETVSGKAIENELPGIISVLGELKPGAIVTEEGVANLFRRHASSVKRAVQRGELPPPTRIFGQQAWTVGAIIRHIEVRLEQAAQERERMERRLNKF